MITTSALDSLGGECLPLRQFLEIVFKLRTGLCQSDSQFVIYRYEVGKEKGIHSHSLIVGMYGY